MRPTLQSYKRSVPSNRDYGWCQFYVSMQTAAMTSVMSILARTEGDFISSLKCEVTPFRRSLAPHGSASVAVWCCAITSPVRLSCVYAIVELKFGSGVIYAIQPSTQARRRRGAAATAIRPDRRAQGCARQACCRVCPPPSPNWMARSAADYRAMALALADSLRNGPPWMPTP